MNSIVFYFAQSAVILAVMYGVFWLFLRKETVFRFSRLFLLLSLVLPFILPLVPLRIQEMDPASAVATVLAPIVITPEKIGRALPEETSLFGILAAVYLTGVAIFTVFFLIKLARIFSLVAKHGFQAQAGYRLVITDRHYAPFSVFHYVFLHRDYLQHSGLAPILAHEQVHIRQLHTLDLLLAEVVKILQWFNPFVWLLGRSLKGVHEYLADNGVLEKGIPSAGYLRLIARESGGIQLNYLTNNFNVLSIKKRIQMITKERSAKLSPLKGLLALPAVLAVLLLFSASPLSTLNAQENKSTATSVKQVSPTSTPVQQNPAEVAKPAASTPSTSQKKVAKEAQSTSEPYTVVDEMPKYAGGQEAMLKFLQANIKYPEEAIKKNIQGKVIVTFTVKDEGTVTNVKVIRGIGSGCDEEAVRVVKLMPKWEPGKQNGKNVAVIYNLPIQFALDKDKEKAK